MQRALKEDDVVAGLMKQHGRHEALTADEPAASSNEMDMNDEDDDDDEVEEIVTAAAQSLVAERNASDKERQEEETLALIKEHLSKSVFADRAVSSLRALIVISSVAFAVMYKSLQSSSFPIVFQLVSLHLCASLALILILHPGPLTNEKASASMRKGVYLIDLVLRIKGLIGNTIQDGCCVLCLSVAGSALHQRIVTLAASRATAAPFA